MFLCLLTIRRLCIGLLGLLAFQTAGMVLAANPTPQSVALPPATTIFDHITLADGLSESTILGIVQDELGFMWFATQNGLNKYDGYQFTVYTHDPNQPNSLSANNLRSLYLDPEGDLWIGTWGGGLNRLNRKTDTITVYRHIDNDSQSLSSDFIWSVKADASGQLWVATSQGLNQVDPQSGQITQYFSDPNNAASLSNDETRAVAVDPDGGLWIGTAVGLNYLDAARHTFTRFTVSPDSINDFASALANASIFTLHFDREGYLWAGTNEGLYQIDPATGAITHYEADPEQPGSLGNSFVLVLYEDRAGTLWVGTREGGLSQLDRATGQFLTYQNNPEVSASLSSNTIGSIFEDRTGILWVGTWAAEINVLDPYRRKFPAAQPFNLPTGIAVTEPGSVWVSTLNDGLFNMDRATGAQTRYVHDSSDPASLREGQIFALYCDREGSLWIGTYTGLDRWVPDSNRFEHYALETDPSNEVSNPIVRAIHQDATGIFWIGTMSGLTRLDPATGSVTAYTNNPDDPNSLSGDVVYTVQTDLDGAVWVGTTNGLNRLDSASGKISRYIHNPSEPAGITNGEITTIHVAKDNTLWIGTWGGGLDHFNPAQNTFEHYSKADGLSDDLVLGILEDASGRLWLTTSDGLTVFDPHSKTSRVYDEGDGLPEPSFVQGGYWQNDDGEMFVGAGVGVVAFYPEDLHDNPNPPTVALTDFQLFNQSVPLGGQSPFKQAVNFLETVTLTHEQSVFSFEFVALGFTNAARNQYAYKLEGFDRDWNNVGTRRLATYTNLNPGTYTFRVKASNNDNLWNEDGLAIEVIILPPWWQTWWAYTLYVVTGSGLIMVFIQFRTRTQARELAQERKLRETLERVEQMKDEDRARLAREMHDGLAQTLAGLRLRSNTWKTLLNNDSSQLPAEFEDLGLILDDSLEEVRRSIFDLRPLLLEEEGLFEAIAQLATYLSQQHPLEVLLDLTGDEKTLPPDIAHATFRIIQELSQNVVKHANSSRLWVTLAIDKKQVRLEVRDDGQGFNPSQIAGLTRTEHYGLDHVQQRVALLKGTLNIESAAQQGAIFKISLPA